jgi:hypothetical protein
MPTSVDQKHATGCAGGTEVQLSAALCTEGDAGFPLQAWPAPF